MFSCFSLKFKVVVLFFCLKSETQDRALNFRFLIREYKVGALFIRYVMPNVCKFIYGYLKAQKARMLLSIFKGTKLLIQYNGGTFY